MLYRGLAMYRRHIKIVLISLISFLLLYYSVAWAVLKCVHFESHDNYEVALDTDAHLKDSYLSFSRTVESHLDCLGADYHTESLAGPSSLPQFHRGAAYRTSHATDYLNYPSGANGHARHLWLSADLDRFLSPTFLTDLSRYLSLTTLRI